MTHHTADAGQAYEVLDVEFIFYVLLQLQDEIRRQGLPHRVAVRKTRKCETFFFEGHNTVTDCRVFSLHEILTCMFHLLMMRVYRCANVYAYQPRGLPIGGPASFALLQTALTFLETRGRSKRATRDWLAEIPGRPDQNLTQQELLSAYRYVDDLKFSSAALCEKCLSAYVPHIYKQWVVFDPNTEVKERWQKQMVKFLDFWAVYEKDEQGEWQVDFYPENPNEGYALTGKVEDRKKQRYMPCPGKPTSRDLRVTAGIVNGRFHRWKELQLKPEGYLYYVALELCELHRCGYSNMQLKQIWRLMSPSCEIWQTAFAVLSYPASSSDSLREQCNSQPRAAFVAAAILAQHLLRMGGKGDNNKKKEETKRKKEDRNGSDKYGGDALRQLEKSCNSLARSAKASKMGEQLLASGWIDTTDADRNHNHGFAQSPYGGFSGGAAVGAVPSLLGRYDNNSSPASSSFAPWSPQATEQRKQDEFSARLENCEAFRNVKNSVLEIKEKVAEHDGALKELITSSKSSEGKLDTLLSMFEGMKKEGLPPAAGCNARGGALAGGRGQDDHQHLEDPMMPNDLKGTFWELARRDMQEEHVAMWTRIFGPDMFKAALGRPELTVDSAGHSAFKDLMGVNIDRSKLQEEDLPLPLTQYLERMYINKSHLNWKRKLIAHNVAEEVAECITSRNIGVCLMAMIVENDMTSVTPPDV